MPETNNSKTRRIEIEYNEPCYEIGLKSYKGQSLTPELLKEIQRLDEIILYSEFVYFKFYFDEYIDDEIVNHLRVDIGDGIKNNLEYYEYLEEFMGWNLQLLYKI